ncbi:SepM family pheromone-processing serine protease [Neobacillus terrae]|uniref:SepM family pheromone-processing serine protease n=1 Tax=Neobacillus terrae TaxID=3034837 RepID=UPI001407B3C1|nr:SepM family pheromone-processing serine protease [Neobacillus terrae]NHM32696.1 PDZ domain-containing protein [Neobacillus terrae]
MEQNKKRYSKRLSVFLVIGLLFLITLFIPTPYYLYQPGSVEELSSKVSVENGHKSHNGKFYLTTILSIKASNIYYLIYGKFAPHTQIMKEEEVKGDMSESEYNSLLTHMMKTSQESAMASGLRAAGEKVDIQQKGVFISNILPESKAKGVLQVGDVVTSIDGVPTKNTTDFKKYLSGKPKGTSVTIQSVRKGKLHTNKIKLIEIDKKTKTAGLGIYPEDEIAVKTPRKVTFHTEDIGGPSAGLMFSLEILSQVLPEDLKKGYKIAGTGTMDLEGNVGQIGGIRDKIVAAHNENVDIFFCPADQGPDDTNQKEVKDEAKKLGYKDIKIVPVKTLEDAEIYLNHLKPKK